MKKSIILFMTTITLCLHTGMSDASVTDVQAFVTRFYQQCLNRNPDQVGLDSWVNSLLDGTLTGSHVAQGFVFSQEFTDLNTTNEEFLTILYRAFFNRDPDAAGFQSWLLLMDSGTSRGDILNGFLDSQEFYNLCYSYGISPNLVSAFVRRFYQQCLNRDPDQAGLDTWTNSLLAGSQSGSDVAWGFIFSQEFENRGTRDADYLTILYRAFFNREPDAAGFNAWIEQLNSGARREDILNGFIGSNEFIALCDSYGIVAFFDEGSFFPKTGRYWRYRINGGLPIVSDFEGITLTMMLNDIQLSVNPNSLERKGFIDGTVSAEGYSGPISANFVEQLDPSSVATLVNSQSVNIMFELSGFGEFIGVEIHVDSSLNQPLDWFLDRSDLDRLPIGYVYDEQGLINGISSGYLRIYGDDSYYEPFDNVPITSTDTWIIIDKLPSYAVYGVSYENVVVVERYTQVPGYDVTLENVKMTYWVAKGVGMIRGNGQYRILDQPLEIELVETGLQ